MQHNFFPTRSVTLPNWQSCDDVNSREKLELNNCELNNCVCWTASSWQNIYVANRL